jgi:hypothetical protein
VATKEAASPDSSERLEDEEGTVVSVGLRPRQQGVLRLTRRRGAEVEEDAGGGASVRAELGAGERGLGLMTQPWRLVRGVRQVVEDVDAGSA